MNKRRGRPTLYGLDVITGERIKRARIALASGSSRKRIALDIFKVSPRTFRRYLATDHPIAKTLKRAVKQGELLKDEPLAPLICMLIDQHNKMMVEYHQLFKSEVLPNGLTYLTDDGVSEEAEKEIELKRNELEALRAKISNTVKDNEDVKQYLKKDGRKNYTVSVVEDESIEPIDLNEITNKLGIKPFNLNNYLYKER